MSIEELRRDRNKAVVFYVFAGALTLAWWSLIGWLVVEAIQWIRRQP